MKKLLIILSIGLFTISCSNDKKEEKVDEELKAKTKAVESATNKLKSKGKNLENKVKSTESEVDSLLNDI